MYLTEILENNSKIKSINDVVVNLDLIVELAKEDIYRIAKSKCILFNDFDFTFSCAVEVFKNQLNKPHLKGIERFLKTENIKYAVNWIIARILNNMRNSFNHRYASSFIPILEKLDDHIIIDTDYENIFELMELEKLDRDILKKGLQSIWTNLILEEDFFYLCEKFGFEVSEIVEPQLINLQRYNKEQVGNGNFQLAFMFESEIV